ncbi:acyltransferase [Kineosporia sp. J2-2]|uniref:Acyltransferase n=1 Tax=Kineosporia corallincola TaxID=2835133 RepID=A0ABS5TEF5_9ACTN|nr:acyltransferase [Kineosporia corallincola]MBT0769475.1 acyltransferase [Kineosporia corallincola]
MNKHITALDGVRGLAILAVIITHVLPTRGGGGLWIGVDVFFVLSGYLITKILMTEWNRYGSISLRRFYIRRALRLYPALITAVLLCIPFGPIISGSWHEFGLDALMSITYMTDLVSFLAGNPNSGLGHTWSLAIEEHFYLAWPPVLFLALKRHWNLRALTAVSIVVALVFLWIYRVSEANQIPPGYFAPHARAFAPLIGCLLAIVLHDRRRYSMHPLGAPMVVTGLAGLAVVAAVADRFPRNDYLFPESVGAAGAAALVITGVVIDQSSQPARLLECGPLRWMGKISYGWYLYHFPVFTILDHYVADGGVRFALALPGSMLLASASYRWIETPFLRRKKQYAPSRSSHEIIDLTEPQRSGTPRTVSS